MKVPFTLRIKLPVRNFHLVYGNEEYKKRLEDIIWIICDEYSWALPAHVPIDEPLALQQTCIDLFAEETQLQRLSELGDSLEKLNVIDFESFRPLLEKVNCKERKSKAGRSLTDEQRESNRRKSKIRCRIEHVFGFITVSMHGLTVRSIGIKRAEFNIGLTNLVYNFCRYTILKRKEVYMG